MTAKMATGYTSTPIIARDTREVCVGESQQTTDGFDAKELVPLRFFKQCSGRSTEIATEM